MAVSKYPGSLEPLQQRTHRHGGNARSPRLLVTCALLAVSCGESAEPATSDTNTTTSMGATITNGSTVSSSSMATMSGGTSTTGSNTATSTTTNTSAGGATSTGTGGAQSSGGASVTGQGGSAAAPSSTEGGPTGGSGGSGVSEACAMPGLSPGNSNRTLDVGGSERKFILHVPEGYTGTERVPLVLDFHPLGGTGSQEQGSSGYQRIADQEGFLIAFADGIDNAWNIGPCCTNSRDVDDLGFARAMVETISAEGCVDPKRVYATGVSMGGGMSHHLACNATDVFAAVTPAAFDLLVAEEQPCAPSRPISVLAFRGTQDTVVPYAGGAGPSGRITFLGAQGSFARWAELNGCGTTSVEEGECTYYKECDGGVEVGLCVAQGGGHAPGDAALGWQFLSRFTLP